MTYQGYEAALEIDEKAAELFGESGGMRHFITFQGKTVEEVAGSGIVPPRTA